MRRIPLLMWTLAALLAAQLLVPPASAATTTARSLLSKLAVGAESGSNSYQRTSFKHWTDADKDSCTTRHEVLIAESKVKVHRGRSRCTVLAGRWVSWYDGKTWTKP